MQLSKHPNRAEILLVGNELLIGKTKDTNGAFLIRGLMELGCVVSRMAVVPDELEAISEAVVNSLSRQPAFLFTSGGLGPTFDDMTLKGVALGVEKFTGRPLPLELHERALEMLKGHYLRSPHAHIAKLSELNPARRKMAHLPRGSEPIANPAGAAPGVHLSVGSTRVFCLPGVPRELEAMFTREVSPLVKKLVVPVEFHQGSFLCYDVGESAMAEGVEKFQRDHPEVYVKTHPRLVANLPVEVHVTSFEGRQPVANALKLLKRLVLDLGGRVVEEPGEGERLI
ncbi:MAG: nicotinamide mononucleotide deamidase-related protein [Promethearchaeota archaeon]